MEILYSLHFQVIYFLLLDFTQGRFAGEICFTLSLGISKFAAVFYWGLLDFVLHALWSLRVERCRRTAGRTDTVTRIMIFGDDITLPLNKLAKYRRHVGRVYFDKYSKEKYSLESESCRS